MRSIAGRMIVEVWIVCLAVLAVLSVLAVPAIAQQRMPGPGPRGDRPTDEQREEIRKKMEAIRIARLTEELNLDEKTAVKFFPALTALDQKRRTLLMENQEALREMRTLLAAQPPDEAKLKQAIGRIEKNQNEILSLRKKEFATIREYLSVQQQARYLLFHQEFQREMRGLVEGAGGFGRGPAAGQGRGPQRGALPPGQ